MSDYVRVTDPANGAQVTISRGHAKAAGLTPLQKDAVDRYGVPLPALLKTDKAGQPVEPKTTGGKSAAQKESN